MADERDVIPPNDEEPNTIGAQTSVYSSLLPLVKNSVKTETGVSRDGGSIEYKSTTNNRYVPNLSGDVDTRYPLEQLKNLPKYLIEKHLFDKNLDFVKKQTELRLLNKMGGRIYNPLGIVKGYTSVSEILGGKSNNELESIILKTFSDITGSKLVYTTDGETFGSFVDTIPETFIEDVDTIKKMQKSGNSLNRLLKFGKRALSSALGTDSNKDNAYRSIIAQVLYFDGSLSNTINNFSTDATKIENGLGKNDNTLAMIYGSETSLENFIYNKTRRNIKSIYEIENPSNPEIKYKIGLITQRDGQQVTSEYYNKLSNSRVGDEINKNYDKQLDNETIVSIRRYEKMDTVDSLNDDKKIHKKEVNNLSSYTTIVSKVDKKEFDRTPIDVSEKLGINNIKNKLIEEKYDYTKVKQYLTNQYENDEVTVKAIDNTTLENISKQRYMLFHNKRDSKYIYLDCNFETLTDDIQPTVQEASGGNITPERIVTGFNRNVALSFKLFARSPDELKSIYDKINYLKYMATPRLSGYVLVDNYLHFTLGNLFSDVRTFITSVSTTFDNSQYTWEVSDKYIVPRVVDCTLGLTLLYSKNSISESDYSKFFHNVGV